MKLKYLFTLKGLLNITILGLSYASIKTEAQIQSRNFSRTDLIQLDVFNDMGVVAFEYQLNSLYSCLILGIAAVRIVFILEFDKHFELLITTVQNSVR